MRRLLAVVTVALVPTALIAHPAQASPAAPSERVCFDVAGAPGDVELVNLTPVEATAPGNGQLISSDVVTPPEASNVNFGPGTVDPNVAATKVGTDGRVCFVNSVHGSVHVIADDLGSLASSAFTPTSGGAPLRRVDTRVALGGDILDRSERLCFTVNGQAGDVAMVNLTPVSAQRAGFGVLLPDDSAIAVPTTSNVNFGPGTVDPNVAFATIGTSGKVCFVNSVHGTVHLVADELGTIAKAVVKPAATGGIPKRVVDTRLGVGGGMIAPSGRLCFAVAGTPGDLALVNLTPVDATRAGYGQLVSSDVTTPADASNVNFSTRTFDPNVAAAVIGADGTVCFVNSVHAAVHLVADHLLSVAGSAYTPPTPSGALLRVIDTRPVGSLVTRDSSLLPTRIDCLTSEACVVAVGSSPMQSLTITGNGSTVALGAAPTPATVPARASSLECALVDKCFAAVTSDDRVASLHVTTNRGATWAAAALPRTVDALNDITCASSIRCLAAGFDESGGAIEGVLFATSNGGTSWSEVALSDDVDQIQSIDCPSGTLCLMLAKDGATPPGSGPTRILRSTNAGSTWTTVSVPTGAPYELTCPTATTCLAFSDFARHLSTDAGVSWNTLILEPGARLIRDVECPSLDRCVATQDAGAPARPGTTAVLVSTDLFTTWTIRYVVAHPGRVGSAVDLSCSATTACYVTGWYDAGSSGGFVSTFSIA